MVLFGPAGNSDSFYAQGHKHTYQAFAWVKQMGLDAFEYSFGHGVRIGQTAAEKIREQAQAHGIALSAHAPYYINLATAEDDKASANVRYFLQTLTAAIWMGVKRIVLHPGSVSSMDERAAGFERVKKALADIVDMLKSERLLNIYICPETMGRLKQIGDLDEIIELCGIDEHILPAIDFGHLHARGQGALQTEDDFAAVLDRLENGLGKERVRHFHVHFSRIEYSAAGEKMHRTFADTKYGPEFTPLARQIVKRGLEPVFICESRGTMAEDALEMKRIYSEELESL